MNVFKRFKLVKPVFLNSSPFIDYKTLLNFPVEEGNECRRFISIIFISDLVSGTALALGHRPRYIFRLPFRLHYILVFGTSANLKINILIGNRNFLCGSDNDKIFVFIGIILAQLNPDP